MGSAFPNSLISTCDIHPNAVNFHRDILGLDSYLSQTSPEMLDVPPQDVFVAMSFFSHMPEATYARWISALLAKLEPNGALIFTANGHVTQRRRTTGVAPDERGFGFLPRSEQGDLDGETYGITISQPHWVFKTMEAHPGVRLAYFQEGLWWDIQDTYVFIKD
jgi:hypothetical protein